MATISTDPVIDRGKARLAVSWWRRVFLIAKVSKLVDIRIVAPEFRPTRVVIVVLAIAALFIAGIFSSIVVVAVVAGPIVLGFLGPVDYILSATMRGLGVFFLIHHLLSFSGRDAREVRAPADAAILAHAGCTNGQIVTARVFLPVAVETAIMVFSLLGCGLVGVLSWGLSASTMTSSLTLALGLTVSGALVRGSAMAVLAMSGVSPTLLRSLTWCVVAVLAGVMSAGFIVPAMLGQHDLRESSVKVSRALLSGKGTAGLAAAVGVMTGAALLGCWYLRHRAWDALPVNSQPMGQPMRLPLPRSAWARLVVLPLAVLRDSLDSEAGEFLISVRTAALTASFGVGALVVGRVPHFVPPEAAWGLAAGGPFVAAGLSHGVCSVNSVRVVLPYLTSSPLGDRGVASALAVSQLVLAAPMGIATVPLLLVASDIPWGSALTAWLIGAVSVPGIMLIADCLFPARLPAESNGRVRQHPLASLLAALMSLGVVATAVTILQKDVPAVLAILAGAVFTATVSLVSRLPRGTT